MVQSPELSLVHLRPANAVFRRTGLGAGSECRLMLPPSIRDRSLTSVSSGTGCCQIRWVAEVRREAFAAKQGRHGQSMGSSLGASRMPGLVIHIETLLFERRPLRELPRRVDRSDLLVARLTAKGGSARDRFCAERIPFGRATRASLNVTTFPAMLQWMHCVPRIPKRVVGYHLRPDSGPPRNSPGALGHGG